jgi:hypothetical protein
MPTDRLIDIFIDILVGKHIYKFIGRVIVTLNITSICSLRLWGLIANLVIEAMAF